MHPLPQCQHAQINVEANGRVVITTRGPGGHVTDQRRFRNMRAAHKAIARSLYCGARGAVFLPEGKNRSMDLLWAQSRLNGLGAAGGPKRFREGDCVVSSSGRKMGVVRDTRPREVTVAWDDGSHDRYVPRKDLRHCGSRR